MKYAYTTHEKVKELIYSMELTEEQATEILLPVYPRIKTWWGNEYPARLNEAHTDTWNGYTCYICGRGFLSIHEMTKLEKNGDYFKWESYFMDKIESGAHSHNLTLEPSYEERWRLLLPPSDPRV